MFRVLAIIAFTFSTPLTSFGQSGSVELGTPQFQGGTVKIPVSLTGDVGTGGVSAMDFRFRYDPAVFEPVGIAAGEAASSAQKLVQANVARPGEYVVLMFGLNQETVATGEVAEITLKLLDQTLAGQSELSVSNTTISLANATDLPSTGSSMTINLGQPEPEEPQQPPQEQPEAPQEPEPTQPEQPQTPPVIGAPPTGVPPVNGETPRPVMPQVTATAKPVVVPTRRGVQADALKKQLEAADAARAALPAGGAEGAARDSATAGVDSKVAGATQGVPGAAPMTAAEGARSAGQTGELAATTREGGDATSVASSADPADQSEESSNKATRPIFLALGVGVVVLAALLGLRKFIFR